MKYEIFCGSKSTMENIAKKGAKALNPKTMKWEVIDRNAQYSIKEDFRIIDDEGNERIGATLLSNIDLRSIVKEKGLII